MSSTFQDITSKSLEVKSSLLTAGFAGDLITPTDSDYEASIIRCAKNAQKRAGLVAYVKSSEDVSRIIKYATSNNVQIVVRGGGHSVSGSSSVEGGIVIDLSKHLNAVRIDEEKRLGYVGGGANWAAVDTEAIKYGLASVGGTVNHTGVGGLTLGGGFGWLTGDYGLVIDNLLQATLVTADGEIRTVNAESHPDLFWAIRGGGCNFGCATEFVYQLHPQRKTVFAGPIVFPPPMLSQVVAVLEDWHNNASPQEAAILITSTNGLSKGPEVVVLVFYNGEEDEGRKRFKSLIDLGPVMNLAGMIPYEQVNALQNPNVPYGANYALKSNTRSSLSGPIAEKLFQELIETADKPSSAINNPVMAILWEYYHLKKQTSIAPDATAFRMRVDRPVSVVMITWGGDGEEGVLDARERVRKMTSLSDELLMEGRKRHDDETGYGNYEIGDPATGRSAEALFGGNYPRLQKIKKDYDPNVVFSSWYPIVPSN